MSKVLLLRTEDTNEYINEICESVTIKELITMLEKAGNEVGYDTPVYTDHYWMDYGSLDACSCVIEDYENCCLSNYEEEDER